jgi:thiosulfate/3-mercaptopyruvate sulfurtransferase
MNGQFVGFMAPPVEELEDMLRNYGVSNSSKVIIYDQGMTSSDTAKSARVLWTLHWLGHENCAILNGGFNAWEQKELPVTTDTAFRPRGDFKASLKPELVITLAEVREKMGNGKTVFIDLREPFQHFGHEKKSNIAKFGHLTGSLLMPAAYMTIGGQNFSPAYMRSAEELQQMASGVGLPDNRDVEIVVYSNTGEQAALGYFVLDTMLGYRNVRLFDGSMLEASKADGIPISMNAWGWNESGAVIGK